MERTLDLVPGDSCLCLSPADSKPETENDNTTCSEALCQMKSCYVNGLCKM